MAFGFPEETDAERKARLYKEYYKASCSHDEWAGERQEHIRQEISDIEEAESWGHFS